MRFWTYIKSCFKDESSIASTKPKEESKEKKIVDLQNEIAVLEEDKYRLKTTVGERDAEIILLEDKCEVLTKENNALRSIVKDYTDKEPLKEGKDDKKHVHVEKHSKITKGNKKVFIKINCNYNGGKFDTTIEAEERRIKETLDVFFRTNSFCVQTPFDVSLEVVK